jgi:hypothetical protein
MVQTELPWTEGLRFKPRAFSTCITNPRPATFSLSSLPRRSQRLGLYTMKHTARRILAPTRNVLPNLLLEERPGTLARGPLCRRCLYTLRSVAGGSQKIGRLSATRTRRNHVSLCGFWHEETRRRRPAALQTRPFATVREGMLFNLAAISNKYVGCRASADRRCSAPEPRTSRRVR